MKSFIKFLVTLLVVCILGYVIYYLVINNIDGERAIDKIDNVDEYEEKSGEIDENMISGENSGEITVENNSGEIENVLEVTEEKINLIDEMVRNIASGEVLQTLRFNISGDMLWTDARNLIEYLNVPEISSTINIRKEGVEIIPDSDFLENQIFYYDETGNLILLECVSTTVGGSLRYYFDDDELIETVKMYEEDINPELESASEILNRAKLIYNEFLTNR